MINRVTLLGYVGDQPEVRSFESGSRMARLRLATTEKIYVQKSQKWQDHTEWHTVILWGESATFADKYIKKGSQIYVEGALRYRDVTNKDGIKQLTTEIAGKEIKIISQPKEQKATEHDEPTRDKAEIIPPKKDIDDIPF